MFLSSQIQYIFTFLITMPIWTLNAIIFYKLWNFVVSIVYCQDICKKKKKQKTLWLGWWYSMFVYLKGEKQLPVVFLSIFFFWNGIQNPWMKDFHHSGCLCSIEIEIRNEICFVVIAPQFFFFFIIPKF